MKTRYILLLSSICLLGAPNQYLKASEAAVAAEVATFLRGARAEEGRIDPLFAALSTPAKRSVCSGKNPILLGVRRVQLQSACDSWTRTDVAFDGRRERRAISIASSPLRGELSAAEITRTSADSRISAIAAGAGEPSPEAEVEEFLNQVKRGDVPVLFRNLSVPGKRLLCSDANRVRVTVLKRAAVAMHCDAWVKEGTAYRTVVDVRGDVAGSQAALEASRERDREYARTAVDVRGDVDRARASFSGDREDHSLSRSPTPPRSRDGLEDRRRAFEAESKAREERADSRSPFREDKVALEKRGVVAMRLAEQAEEAARLKRDLEEADRRMKALKAEERERISAAVEQSRASIAAAEIALASANRAEQAARQLHDDLYGPRGIITESRRTGMVSPAVERELQDDIAREERNAASAKASSQEAIENSRRALDELQRQLSAIAGG